MTDTAYSKPIVLITGATRGIGRATALHFAKNNWHVVALARKQDDLERLDDEIGLSGGSATLIPQDLRQIETLYQLGPNLFERIGQLNAVILNAAILGPLTPIAQIEKRDWDKVMNINLNAQFALIQTLDPLLRATPNSHLVGLTTGRVNNPKAYWGPYAASKAGFAALIETYKLEVAHTGTHVSLFEPGRVKTEMRAEAYPGEDVSLLRNPNDVAADLYNLITK